MDLYACRGSWEPLCVTILHLKWMKRTSTRAEDPGSHCMHPFHPIDNPSELQWEGTSEKFMFLVRISLAWSHPRWPTLLKWTLKLGMNCTDKALKSILWRMSTFLAILQYNSTLCILYDIYVLPIQKQMSIILISGVLLMTWSLLFALSSMTCVWTLEPSMCKWEPS